MLRQQSFHGLRDMPIVELAVVKSAAVLGCSA